jgi:hypothetical protein
MAVVDSSYTTAAQLIKGTFTMLLLSSFRTPFYKYFQAGNLIYREVLSYSFRNKGAGSYSGKFHDINKSFSID